MIANDAKQFIKLIAGKMLLLVHVNDVDGSLGEIKKDKKRRGIFPPLLFQAAIPAKAFESTSGYISLKFSLHHTKSSCTWSSSSQLMHLFNSLLNNSRLKLTFGKITFAYSNITLIFYGLRFQYNKLILIEVCQMSRFNNH